MTPTELSALQALKGTRQPGQSVAELAFETAIHESTLRRALARLEAAGLVKSGVVRAQRWFTPLYANIRHYRLTYAGEQAERENVHAK